MARLIQALPGQTYARPGHVGALAEAPGIDIAAALNLDRYFAKGRTLAPWTMTLNDGDGARAVTTGATASPGGLLTARSVDLTAQEDSLAFTWKGNASVAIEGPGGDVSRELLEGFALVVQGRIDDVATAPVTLSFAGIDRDISKLVATKGMTRIVVPLHCFTDDKAKVASVGNPFRLKTDGRFALTVEHIDLEAVADQRCP